MESKGNKEHKETMYESRIINLRNTVINLLGKSRVYGKRNIWCEESLNACRSGGKRLNSKIKVR